MSYQLQAATGRRREFDASWEPVDIANQSISNLLRDYKGLYWELTHFAYPHPVFLNMRALEQSFTAIELQMTPQAWLTSIGNRTLPISNTLPSPREIPVRYADVFRAGYDVQPVAIGRHPESGISVRDKNDLLLTKSGVDFNQLWRYMLVTVNGLLHRCVKAPDGIYVLDGARTGRLANSNLMGVLSFRQVGAVKQLPIQKEMIQPLHVGQPLASGFMINLPESVEGKTVLLSVGGHLQVLDETYAVNGAQSVKVNFSKLNFVDRVMSTRLQMNMETVRLAESVTNPGQFLTESFFYDRVIEAYMTLPQSFVIVVDTPDFYLRRQRVENTRLPGVYQCEGPFRRLPLFGTYGRILDYTAYREDEKYVINTVPHYEPRLMYRTTEWETGTSLDITCQPARPYQLADAFFMDFGRFA